MGYSASCQGLGASSRQPDNDGREAVREHLALFHADTQPLVYVARSGAAVDAALGRIPTT
jgi:hypothetical protein